MGQSISKEVALGEVLAREVEHRERILPDPAVNDYVARLAGAVAQHAALVPPLSIKVIDSGEVRAVALPGGFLYVTRGLIARAETEAELAGVLAHEIAHLALKHSARPVFREGNTATVPLIFAGTWAGSCTRWATDKQVPASLLPTLSELEREADNAAIQYLRSAAYDPLAMIEFFNKLRYEEPRLAQTWSSEELIALRTHVEETFPPDPEYIVTTMTFDRIHAHISAQSNPIVSAESPSLTIRRR
jgi:predicted Zn-dependent protease